MKILVQALDGFFFQPVKHHGLGILRMSLISYLVFFRLDPLSFGLSWSNALPEAFMNPGVAVRYSPIPFPFPELHVETFRFILMEIGLCAAVGFLTRPTLFLFTIGYLYLIGVESSWGWHDHGPSMIAQILVVLVVAPGTASFSVDRLAIWFRERRGGTTKPLLETLAGPAVPRWGLQLVLITVALFYFASGSSKIRHGGLEWLDGNTLRFYMSGQSRSNDIQQFGSRVTVPDSEKWKDGFGLEFYLYGALPTTLSTWVSERPIFGSLAATSAVLLELLVPLILLGGHVKNLLLLSAAVFHVVVYFSMGIVFFSWIVVDLAMLDWQALKRLILRRSEAL